MAREKEHAAEALAANLTSKLQGSMRDARPKPGTVDDLEANIFYVHIVVDNGPLDCGLQNYCFFLFKREN